MPSPVPLAAGVVSYRGASEIGAVYRLGVLNRSLKLNGSPYETILSIVNFCRACFSQSEKIKINLASSSSQLIGSWVSAQSVLVRSESLQSWSLAKFGSRRGVGPRGRRVLVRLSNDHIIPPLLCQHVC